MSDTEAMRAPGPPEADVESAWWWESLQRDGFLLPRCRSCKAFSFPPMPACPRCGGSRFDRVAASGRGRLYSWVVVHMALHPAFQAETPYTIVAVDLDEGVRIFGRLREGGTPTDGASVRAVTYDANGVTLLGFELEKA
jgi:uncharacterized OB-fold protein